MFTWKKQNYSDGNVIFIDFLSSCIYNFVIHSFTTVEPKLPISIKLCYHNPIQRWGTFPFASFSLLRIWRTGQTSMTAQLA